MSFALTNSVIAQDKKKSDTATSVSGPGSAYYTTGKSKQMWELGIHGGHVFMAGDVKPAFPWAGFGVGAHIRRGIDYPFSWRLDVGYQQFKGFSPRSQSDGYIQDNRLLTADPTLAGYLGRPIYFNYKATTITTDFQGIWSLNQWNYKQRLKRVNWYVLGGIGLDFINSKMDLKDGSGNLYNFPTYEDVAANGGSSYVKQVSYIKDQANVDGKYETELDYFTPHGDGSSYEKFDRLALFNAQVGTGISFRINPRFNIGIEHDVRVFFGNDADFVDGYRLKGGGIETQYRDVVNYTNVRLNFNLGNKDKASEPLYWVGPLDMVANDLAEVKARPKLDLTDTDADGIIDMLDQEKDTPKGCAVDTRGVKLDSDGDGYADCNDKEPYSPPGYKVDNNGVAMIPKETIITEKDVNRIVDEKMGKISTKSARSCDWFLPTVNFDVNKYCVKDAEAAKLQQVATVLKNCPDLRVVAYGHTDKPASDAYNNVLSYNRAKAAVDYIVSNFGISRDRLIISYGGEGSNLVAANGSNMANRRVEFRTANGEQEMGRPEGPEAGSDCKGRRVGSNRFGY
ncbi:MAG: OmpA family protein [Saprospiraceae bacterium]|nr:OmpA family protein [Saprospiraceae bacterium]